MDEYVEQKKLKPKGAKKMPAKKVTKGEAKNIFYAQKTKTKGQAGAKGWVGEQYDNLDPGWLGVAYEKAKLFFKGKHRFISHKKLSDFRYRMVDKEGPIRVALIADWGGGNNHAQAVASQIKNLDPAPDHVIHLGDVYYAGTHDEVNRRFIGFWPGSLDRGRSFALNSNHEMYSGGYAYFDIALARLGQEASYFCLENANWRLIGLDTGYIDHDLNLEQVKWLTALLNESDKKNILLSHHQPFSAYESGGAGEERLQRWTKNLTNRITAWFWGHEHLCVVYKSYKGIRGRCVGHGCFPYEIPSKTPPFAGPQVEWVFRASDPKHSDRGLHGFALLEIDNEKLNVSYIDETGRLQYAETL
jgi:Calcineurin-like phosphoesterase